MNVAEVANRKLPLLFENMQKVFSGINVFLCIGIMLSIGA